MFLPLVVMWGGYRSLTPNPKHFLAIKDKHYDIFIFFKNGKFYEMYDVDADTGHSTIGLDFTHAISDDMRCCSVAAQMYMKHADKLITLSYKAGRVEQTATANTALERILWNASSSAFFEGTLIHIETRATVLDEAIIQSDHHATSWTTWSPPILMPRHDVCRMWKTSPLRPHLPTHRPSGKKSTISLPNAALP